jgi:chemotaxis response regulator CheB
LTLAQDRASSVVSSMPDEAIRLGAADLALPPAALAGQLLLWVSGQADALTRPGGRR